MCDFCIRCIDTTNKIPAFYKRQVLIQLGRQESVQQLDFLNMNGILVCAGEGEKKNIGDYIQSVAQEQFFEHTDCYVEREHLDTFQAEEKVNVIMNAWFMWHPENFPPADIINPLFISFHLVPSIADKFFTPKTISYLKKYEPIGARDIGTRNLLERHGIKSYFSGCLTLTLGLKFQSEKHNNCIYFVDPYYDFIGVEEGYGKIKKLCTYLKVFLKHYKSLVKLKKIFHVECFMSGAYRYSKTLNDWICCMSFYNTYSKVFGDDILLNATYLTHLIPQTKFKDNDDKMQLARDLVNKYANAKLVITSRLHCALPCVATETPVVFVNAEKLEEGAHRNNSNGRFEGLTDFMNTLYCKNQSIYAKDEYMQQILKNEITEKTIINNPKSYIKIKDDLISSVNSWLNKQ